MSGEPEVEALVPTIFEYDLISMYLSGSRQLKQVEIENELPFLIRVNSKGRVRGMTLFIV